MAHPPSDDQKNALARLPADLPVAQVVVANPSLVAAPVWEVPFDEEELTDIADCIKKSKALNTQTTYAAAWARYVNWTKHLGLAAIDPSAPIDYAAQVAIKFLRYRACAGKSANTLQIDLAAIGYYRKKARLPPLNKVPEVSEFLTGLAKDQAAPHKASAIMMNLCHRLAAHIGTRTLANTRDRALILMAGCAGLRRSEICEMRQEHFTLSAKGAAVHIFRSKTDQKQRGRDFFLPRHMWGEEHCPVEAVELWLAASGLLSEKDKQTPLFRGLGASGQATKWALGGEDMRRILKKHLATLLPHLPAELRPKPGQKISPHSFRSGFITECYLRGASFEEIAYFTGHKDRKTMDGYFDSTQMHAAHPLSKKRKVT